MTVLCISCADLGEGAADPALQLFIRSCLGTTCNWLHFLTAAASFDSINMSL